MTKLYMYIWTLSFLAIILLISNGMVLPALISTNMLPAWSIAILTSIFIASTFSVIGFLIYLIKKL